MRDSNDMAQVALRRVEKTRSLLICLAVIFAVCAIAPAAKADTSLFFDLEGGIVHSGYNDVRIPGDTGTDLSLSEELSADDFFYYRGRLGVSFRERHTVQFVAAPLEVESTGSVDREIMFRDRIFPAWTELESRFRFNTYRMTWRYRWLESPRFSFSVGLTALVRDALISLEGDGVKVQKTDVGVVPLFHFYLTAALTDRLGLLFEADALAGPQGRAEDAFFGLTWRQGDRVLLRTGYRIIEGGADNDEVYTFSLFHHYAIGLTYFFR